MEAQNNYISLAGTLEELTALLDKHAKAMKVNAEMVSKYGKAVSSISLPSEFVSNLQAITDVNNKMVASNAKVIDSTKKVDQARKREVEDYQRRKRAFDNEIKQEERLRTAKERKIQKVLEENRAYVKLQNSWRNAQKTLQDLLATEKATTEEIRRATKEFERLDKQIRQVDAATKNYSKNVGNYPMLNGLGNLTSQLAGALGWVGALQTAVSLMKSFAGTIITFDSGLLNVSKTTGIAGKELKSLGEDVRKLALDLQVVPVNNLLEYATVAGQLGVKGSENIMKFTKALAMLETATNIKGEEGASEIARLLTLVDGGVQNVAQFGDEIVKLGNNFAATEKEILDNATAIAQNTGVYKIGRQAALAYGTATKAVGIEAEITGSTIGRTLAEIEKSIRTGENIDKLAKITKKSVSELKAEFKTDTASVLYSFVTGLNEIDKSGGSVLGTLDSLGITAVRDKRVIASLATGGYDVLTRALEDVKTAQGAMTEEFDTASGKIENSIKTITVAWDEFALAVNTSENVIGNFFSNFAIGVAGMISWITRLSTSWNELNRQAFNNFQKEGFNKGMANYSGVNTKNPLIQETFSRRQTELFGNIQEKEKEIANLENRIKKINENNQTSFLGTLLGTGNLRRSKDIFTKNILNEELEKANESLGSMKGELSGMQKAWKENIEGAKELNKETGKKNPYPEEGKSETSKERNARIKAAKELINAEYELLKATKERESIEAKASGDMDVYYTRNMELALAKYEKDVQLADLEITNLKTLNIKKAALLEEYIKAVVEINNQEWSELEKENDKKEKELKKLEEERLKDVEDFAKERLKWQEWADNKELESAQKKADRLEQLQDKIKGIISGGFSFGEFGFGSLDILNDGGMKDLIDAFESGALTMEEKWAASMAIIGSVTKDAMNMMQESSNRYFENQFNQLEKEKEVALKYAGENKAGQEAIEAQYTERKKQLQRQRAKQEKQMAIFNAVINIAQGVTAALAQAPPYSFILAALVGALGAVQIASIASQPLPQFWKGTDNAPEGWAIVDELRPEVHTDKHGNIKSTGSKSGANLRYLESGDKIYKSHDAFFREMNSQIMFGGGMSVEKHNEISIDYDRLDKMFANNIAKMEQKHITIDKRGFNVHSIKGNNKTIYANNKITV